MNRRQFFQASGASLLLAACDFKLGEAPVSKTVVKIYSGYRVGEAYVSKDAGMHIGSINQNSRVKLANEIHSVIHSKKYDLKVFTSKLELTSYAQIGEGALIPFNAAEGNYFYGHAVVDELRNCLYASQARITKTRDENDRTEEPGFVYVYSIPEFKIVDKFSSFGFDPHDLRIVKDELVVCNGGKDSNVAFIDLKTKKLTRDYKINQSHISLRHCEVVDEENYLIASLTTDLNKPCPLYNLNLKTGLRAFLPPENLDMVLMRAQLLSVLVYKGHVFTTCPFTSSLIVWKTSGEFVGGYDIPAACNLGISAKYDGVIVGSGEDKEVARLIQVENGLLKMTKLPWAVGVTGAHSLILEA